MENSAPSPLFGFIPTIQIKRTLQVNILIAFATLLIITVLIIIGYTYRQNSEAVLSISDDLLNQVTETVIEATTNYLAPAGFMAQASASIPNIETLSLVENEALEAYGMDVLNLYPQLAGFFIGNEKGEFLFTKRFADGSIGTQIIDQSVNPPLRTWTYRDLEGNVTEVEKTTDFTYDPRTRPWYIGAKESQQKHWTDIYIFFTDQKPGITAAYPILDKTGKTIGIIGIDVALDQLSQFLQTQQIGQNGVAFVINGQGEIVAFPNTPLAAAENDSFRPLQVSELNQPWLTTAYQKHLTTSEQYFTFNSDEGRFIASFASFPTTFDKNWQIGIVVPENDFVGSMKQTNQVSILISLIILCVAIIVAIFIARGISYPIVLLTEETRKIKDFQLDDDLVLHSPIKEVQTLGESIAAMKTSLQAFRKYVPDELVRQLIKTGEEAQLGGHKKEMTILFTDVAGFTAITEGMVPEALMLQLSEYLGTLSTIIGQQNGTVDKYMGDGLLAFWGAPAANPNHVADACRAALHCRDKVVALNETWASEGKSAFPTRIGLHTGETLVGNVGSAERMNYTVLGDSVNLASRLEPANSVYQTEIIVSISTYSLVAKEFHFRPLDIVTVKGKQQGLMIYELVGELNQTPPDRVFLAERFTAGFDAYINQQFDVAHDIFQALVDQFPQDRASQIHLTRCKELCQSPPDHNWEPVTDLSNSKQASSMSAVF